MTVMGFCGEQQVIAETEDSDVRVIAVVCSASGAMREQTDVNGCVLKECVLCCMMLIGIQNETQLIGQQI